MNRRTFLKTLGVAIVAGAACPLELAPKVFGWEPPTPAPPSYEDIQALVNLHLLRNDYIGVFHPYSPSLLAARGTTWESRVYPYAMSREQVIGDYNLHASDLNTSMDYMASVLHEIPADLRSLFDLTAPARVIYPGPRPRA